MSQETHRDSGRFAILKNLKAYRDAHSISGENEHALFGDSGYTSSQFTSYSQDLHHMSVRHVSSLLETIDEEQPATKDVLATPSGSDEKQIIITPTTANMQKIMNLHITTPTEPSTTTKSPPRTAEFVEPKTPPKSVNDSRSLNTTPRKPKQSRKRSFVDIEEDAENSNVTKRKKSKDDEEVLAQRMPFSPINTHNQRILRGIERSMSDNNLFHRSSTPKTATLRRKIFAASQQNDVERTPEKQHITYRRHQSMSPRVTLKRRAELVHPYKRSSFDAPGSSKINESSSLQILKNIPETDDIPDEVRRAAPAAASISITDITHFNESFNMSPIKHHVGFDKLFVAPIINTPSYQETDKSTLSNSSISLTTKSMSEYSPSKVPSFLLFNDLPRTPPKEHKSTKKIRATPVKKNLTNRKTFYDELEKMDILNHLQVVPNLIDQIFKHVSDEDLLCATMVSSRWKHIIEGSKILNKRRLNYIVTKRLDIENGREKKVKLDKTENRTLRSSTTKPLGLHNYNTRSSLKPPIDVSPPVSPSMAKFRENQKIIRKFSPKTMTTCIRCGKPSPVITQKARDVVYKSGRQTRSSSSNVIVSTNSAKKYHYDLRKTVSDTSAMKRPFNETTPLFDFDTSSGSSDSGSGSESNKKIRRALFSTNNSSSTNISLKTDSKKNISRKGTTESSPRMLSLNRSSSFTGSNNNLLDTTDDNVEESYSCCGGCSYKFCVKCLMDFRPGHICRSPIEFSSPARRQEELSANRGSLMCSKQSRRMLKRLCS